MGLLNTLESGIIGNILKKWEYVSLLLTVIILIIIYMLCVIKYTCKLIFYISLSIFFIFFIHNNLLLRDYNKRDDSFSNTLGGYITNYPDTILNNNVKVPDFNVSDLNYL